MLPEGSISEMQDWSIILVRNEKGTLLQRFYWWAIRLFTKSEFNHCQLVRSFNNKLYICESDISGFRVTKTLQRWREEQELYDREFIVININGYSDKRFNELLGNKYDAGYYTYITKRYSSPATTNCFQSLAYIFRFPKYWLATANTFINHGRKKICSED
jgi:hypothetical protein